jgi:hypothetical protein
MIYCTCGETFEDEAAFEAHVQEEFEIDGCIRHFNVEHL